MKKFITALATTFATVVIGSAVSAATPTFSVYHEEVLPALAEANTPPTFNVVREEILPAMNRAVADVDPFAEQIVGGIGPQLPYDPMRGVDYGFVQALKQLNAAQSFSSTPNNQLFPKSSPLPLSKLHILSAGFVPACIGVF